MFLMSASNRRCISFTELMGVSDQSIVVLRALSIAQVWSYCASLAGVGFDGRGVICLANQALFFLRPCGLFSLDDAPTQPSIDTPFSNAFCA